MSMPALRDPFLDPAGLIPVLPQPLPLGRAEVDRDGGARSQEGLIESARADTSTRVVCAAAGFVGLAAGGSQGPSLAVRPLAQPIPYSLNIWQPDPARQSQLGERFVEAITRTLDEFVATLQSRRLA